MSFHCIIGIWQTHYKRNGISKYTSRTPYEITKWFPKNNEFICIYPILKIDLQTPVWLKYKSNQNKWESHMTAFFLCMKLFLQLLLIYFKVQNMYVAQNVVQATEYTCLHIYVFYMKCCSLIGVSLICPLSQLPKLGAMQCSRKTHCYKWLDMCLIYVRESLRYAKISQHRSSFFKFFFFIANRLW